MYYVIYDHDMLWDDGCDSDTHSAVFHSSADAYSYACHVAARQPTECDSWVIRRVMHDDTVIDSTVWSAATARDIAPDYADPLLADDLGCAVFPAYA